MICTSGATKGVLQNALVMIGTLERIAASNVCLNVKVRDGAAINEDPNIHPNHLG